VLGVCHFGSFYEAMNAAQHLVKLRPIAVELVDRTMLSLGREIAMFQPIIGTAIRGDPDAVLIVEFAEEDQADNIRQLKQLGELMADLGFGWDQPRRKWGGVVESTEPGLQTGIAEFRAAGLNVMMSMKQEGKPVSFVEDCAVPLPHLADYTERLNGIFAKHGTRGTMYAHASEGCLHVRPVLNLKLEKDVKAMRAIAEEVREGRLRPDQITEETISNHLYTAGMPDPDLLIRTAGEMRVSNYLLWQISYAELFVSPVLWPDFGVEDLHAAICSFASRSRRFGALDRTNTLEPK